MNSRNLLQGKSLKVFIDSKSMEENLNKGNINSKIFLNWTITNHSDVDSDLEKLLDFFRSDFDTKHEDFKKIDSYALKKNKNFDRREFEIRYRRMTFRDEFIELQCKNVFKQNVLKSDQKRICSLLTLWDRVCDDPENTNILVTDDSLLINNRIGFESFFNRSGIRTHIPFNIVSFDEINEIIDIFLKYRNEFFSGPVKFREIDWYTFYFILNVPNFYIDTEFENALSNRFIYAFKSIDEMGIQYFLGVNDNAQMNSIYHFNYFISLITGIFDILAILSKDKYKLELGNNNQKISLNPNNRSDFMVKIKLKNENLHEHIINNDNFIKLIYMFRDQIIHREMFENAFLEYENINFNVLKIDKDILKCLKMCPNNVDKTNREEWWNIHNFDKNLQFIEPFHFSKKAKDILCQFSNTYLELLGYDEFLKNENLDEGFLWGINAFKDGMF